MAGVSAKPLSPLSIASIPKIAAKSEQSENRIRVSSNALCFTSFGLSYKSSNNRCNDRNKISRLNAAGLTDIEPDINEDPVDKWENSGISDVWMILSTGSMMDTTLTMKQMTNARTRVWNLDSQLSHPLIFFIILVGLILQIHIAATFWGSIAEDYAAIDPPTGFQGLISWLFLPAVALGMYLEVPGEYLYIGAAIFVVIFCIIEMDKPSEAYNFEPQIYNMEKGSRDKLISDYNTMDIWDFNEKYGDLWDFTVTKDDIMKR